MFRVAIYKNGKGLNKGKECYLPLQEGERSSIIAPHSQLLEKPPLPRSETCTVEENHEYVMLLKNNGMIMK